MKTRRNSIRLLALAAVVVAAVLLSTTIVVDARRVTDTALQRHLSSSSATSRNTSVGQRPALLSDVTTSSNGRLNVVSHKPPRGGAKQTDAAPSALVQRLKVGFYFALWYALNIVYNILNKKVLNVWPAPLTVGSMQFGVGALYANLIWLLKLRTRPVVHQYKPIEAVGFWHMTGQLCTMMSLGAGPVSFTHIVKALEPFFSAVVSALVFGQWMNPVVYATLLPVVGGVGYACLKERSFSWLAFGFAMASNAAFALRAVLSKVAMSGGDLGTNLTPTNVFGLVTQSAFWLSLPVALLGEGLDVRESWSAATQTQEAVELLKAIAVSGFFHYINNEVMYLALGSVHPVTLAVGNTMKRVFIMVASVMVFRNEITTQAAIGSAIGIGGVLLYSLTKQHYEGLASSPPKPAMVANKGKKGGKKDKRKKKR